MESDPRLYPLTSATIRVDRELLFPKLIFLPSYQECSQLRELSICIFRDQLQAVVGSSKRSNSYLRSVLIPLFFHMSDQSPGVAKVQISRLSSDTDGGGLLAVSSAPPAQPVGKVPAEPVHIGVEKLAWPFPAPALPAPAGLGSNPWPPKLE